MKVVTAAIIEREGRFLIARRDSHQELPGFYEFVGGKVEEGETPQECLKRELEEELCITACIGRFLAESNYRYEHGEFLLKAFIVTSYKGKISMRVHDDIAWVTPEEMQDYNLLPADVPIARALTQIDNV